MSNQRVRSIFYIAPSRKHEITVKTEKTVSTNIHVTLDKFLSAFITWKSYFNRNMTEGRDQVEASGRAENVEELVEKVHQKQQH